MLLLKKYWYWLVSLLVFVMLTLGSLKIVEHQNEKLKDDIRTRTLDLLISKKSNLEKALYSRIYYTRGVAAFVSIHPDISNADFYRLVNEYIKNDSVIGTMSLSPNCIISAIYPTLGHEAAIGLNLLEHPERKLIVEKTIETHETFLAGPVELVEGGTAFISYTPIFDTSDHAKDQFWGLTDIVINSDALIAEANIKPEIDDFNFALKGKDGQGESGEIFWGIPSVFDNQPVSVSIELPYGSWILAASPKVGWLAYHNLQSMVNWMFIVSAFIISLLLFVLLKAMHKIKNDACELKAIFLSMDNLIFELSYDGIYLKVAPTNIDLLILKPEEIIGKSMFEVLEPDLAKLLQDSVTKCLQTREVAVVDYPLEIRGEVKWFLARISYKTEKSVIFNAYDITRIKSAESKLKKSEEVLKQMNDTKDRFFSIVAHDLRNPIGSFVAITDLLLDDNFEKKQHEVQELIQSLNDTATGVSSMLENLLSWALAQQGQIHIHAETNSVKAIINSVVDAQSSHALMKKITIENEIQNDVMAYFDERATNLILRNLVSNAIKFSKENTAIKIHSDEPLIEGQKYVVVKIIDAGIGIPTNKIESIFNVDNKYRKYGTNNEKGSGLGLVLCREFAELQNAKIWVESELNQGSTFSLAIPFSEE